MSQIVYNQPKSVDVVRSRAPVVPSSTGFKMSLQQGMLNRIAGVKGGCGSCGHWSILDDSIPLGSDFLSSFINASFVCSNNEGEQL